MSNTDREKMRAVRDYHQRTKHRPDRYAASLGYMDWANQPNPFRSFAGADPIDLPNPVLRDSPTYDGLFSQSPSAAKLDVKLIGRLFYHSLALSAWKQAPGIDPWSLRINPSSGDLHPTEGYLRCGPVQGLTDEAGVFHYAPFHHRLERRCRLSEQAWQALSDGIPAPCLLIALTSLYWRESWKYGERAFRYCHHDVGHAIGALSNAARTLGWPAQQLERLADEDLNRLLGVHLQTGIDAEHADCLLALFPKNGDGPAQGASRVSGSAWRELTAGVRGTGIGCFFDDLMHDLLGIKNDSWQSLYHFTVGGPVGDPRLKTIPPYAHVSPVKRFQPIRLWKPGPVTTALQPG